MKQSSSYPLRIDDNLKEKMKYVADYNGRSLNKEIEQVMKKAVASFEQTHGEIKLDTIKKAP